MKIYFDSCCYGRHRDDQNDARNAAETIAIMTIIEAARIAGYRIWGSLIVAFELGNIPDTALRADIADFYANIVSDTAVLTAADYARAQSLQVAGVGVVDSQHLAIAEAAGVDYLITTDVKFERVVTKKNLSKVRVINPLIFLAEGIK
jgi:predicted nucleic acid-binding protein